MRIKLLLGGCGEFSTLIPWKDWDYMGADALTAVRHLSWEVDLTAQSGVQRQALQH